MDGKELAHVYALAVAAILFSAVSIGGCNYGRQEVVDAVCASSGYTGGGYWDAKESRVYCDLREALR
jgi:hypothetical protein